MRQVATRRSNERTMSADEKLGWFKDDENQNGDTAYK
jgi:hypothetical protein